MKIVKATKTQIPEVARLFDLYRQFYECDADIEPARNYISERLENNESTIFIAIDDENVCGFVQLYPSFCSVEAVRILILYDLYVDASGRNKGTGALLMNRASEYADEQGAARLDLLTGKDNYPGQHLYEKLGYKKVNEGFYAYSLDL